MRQANVDAPRREHRTRGSRRRNEFRTDIEGLRGVAVLAVVLFHAGIPGFGGGFVGVDVFFVISGFLITGLLWREASSTGKIRLARFYGARARRLLPAAGTVLIATAIAAVVLLPPLQARTALGDAIASALYLGNVRFAERGTDYLSADAAPSPFQHYWSLGVEEQFYFLWPVLIIAVAWVIRRLTRRDAATPGSLGLVLAVVGAASLLLCVAWTHTSPSWAFYSLPTRAWELALGGLVALSAPAWRRLPRPSAAIAGWGGLVLIAITCMQLDTTTPYPGTSALLPVLGAALVIGAGCTATDSGAGLWLSAAWLRAIGRVSYSWYLWHWPVLLFAPVLVGHSLGLLGRVAALALSGGLAVLTMRHIEKPGRYAASLRGSSARSLAMGGAVTAVAVSVAMVMLATLAAPTGRGAPVTPLPNTSDAQAASTDPVEVIRAAVAASVGMRAVPSNLSPPLAAAATKPAMFVNGCVRSWREVGQPECATGDTASPTRVALVGDSHAAMWQPAFEPVAQQHHWRLETMAKVTCPLLELPIRSPYLGREYTECVQWRGEILGRLAAEKPQVVVLAMGRRYGADFGFTTYDRAWLDSLTRMVAQLRATGAHVFVLGPIPDPHGSVPTCLSGHLDNAAACEQPRSGAVDDGGAAAEATATAAGGGQYISFTDLFCTADRCPTIVGNTLVFRDDNHVTTQYAQVLAPVLTAPVAGALQRR